MKLSHAIGIDDAYFERQHRGDVVLVGAVFAGLRFDGIVTGRVRRDGSNATASIARMITASKFSRHVQFVMLQGIAFAGFNVVDVHALHAALALPVLVVARRKPDLRAIRDALLSRVPGGARKWKLIEKAGPMEPLAGVWVQRAGLSSTEAEAALARFTTVSRVPEPLRVAHLVASGFMLGESRGRA
jgi:endonuclease V-like protein UPF0215 family